jgi:hypothetical protein
VALVRERTIPTDGGKTTEVLNQSEGSLQAEHSAYMRDRKENGDGKTFRVASPVVQ